MVIVLRYLHTSPARARSTLGACVPAAVSVTVHRPSSSATTATSTVAAREMAKLISYGGTNTGPEEVLNSCGALG